MRRAMPAGWTAARTLGRTVTAGVTALGLALVLLAPHASADGSFDDCVAKRIAAGEPRATAIQNCLKETGGGTPSSLVTIPKSPTASSSNDGDTSWGLVIGVGLGALVVGVVLGRLLSRRTPASAPASPGGVFAAPGAPFVGPPPSGPPVAPPTSPAPAPAPDRSAGLVHALVDLGDRVPSQALRAEIAAALGRAGVRAVEIEAGRPFDAATMRGVGNQPAPDPSWVGRVASTERPGFVDGAQVIRPPDVVVYTAS